MFRNLKLLFFTIFLFSGLFAQDVLPEKPQSWVNDYANVLSASEKQTLTGMLQGLEQRSSNQIFVAIFESMPENTYLEDFALKLYDKWKPGLAEQDNGVIMVIFINDRKVRIEVGYGLEDVITDAQSGTVIRDYMAPYFRQGDYYHGIEAALSVLIPAAEGKYQIPVKSKNKNKGGNFTYYIILFILVMLISKFFWRRRIYGIRITEKRFRVWRTYHFWRIRWWFFRWRIWRRRRRFRRRIRRNVRRRGRERQLVMRQYE